MSARAAIAQAEAAGVHLRLDADGQVRLSAAAPPPPDLLAELRRHRDEVARLLAAERRPAWAAVAPKSQHAIYMPGDPDPLRDGLLASARRYLLPLPSSARGLGSACAEGEN